MRAHILEGPRYPRARNSHPMWEPTSLELESYGALPDLAHLWRANGPTLPISDVYYEKPITPSGDDGRRRRLAPGGPFIGENPGK